MEYFYAEPEVPGGLGADTVLDQSTHPPRVENLHFEFSGWLGDDLIESFPCYLASDRLVAALSRGNLTGYSLAPVKITRSDEFLELFPDTELPHFHWLRISGSAQTDDFGISKDHRLVMSASARTLLESFSMAQCSFSPCVS